MVGRNTKPRRKKTPPSSSPSLEFLASLAVADAANKNVIAAVFILLFVVAMVMIYINNNKRTPPAGDSTASGGGENLVGNVGGGGIYRIDDSDIVKGQKPRLCYKSSDCPSQTTCGSEGMCIPMIQTLPQSRHLLKMGSGREGEKAT